MAHILQLYTTVVVRDSARKTVRETKSIEYSRRDFIQFKDGTKITFGYLGQQFTGLRFDLIVEDESMYGHRESVQYIECINTLRHRCAL